MPIWVDVGCLAAGVKAHVISEKDFLTQHSYTSFYNITFLKIP